MSSSSVSFPIALAKRLENLREHVLELTQYELANSADVAQGTYSNLMLGKGVRAKSARAIVVAIQQAVEQHIRRTNRTPEEGAELLRDVAWAAAVLESGLDADAPSGSTQTGTPADLKILDRFAQQALAGPIKIHQPGGAVPSDAVPYVKREHDERVLDTLQLSTFAMLVRGPSQSGKSTTLSLLERRAREIGIETASFDPQSSDTSAGIKHDVDGDAAYALSELLQASWGLQRPRRGSIDTIPKLINWLLEELAPTRSKPRILILDDLAALGGAAAERWLNLFVRAMVDARAKRGVNINVAVGLTEHFGASFARKLVLISTVVHWKPVLVLDWLNQADVKTLWQHLRSGQATVLDESALGTVYEMFQGQPYLTHAALIDKEFHDAVCEWLLLLDALRRGEDVVQRISDVATVIRQFPWYRRHLRAITLTLCGPTPEPNVEASSLIKSFADLCSALTADERPEIDGHHGLFLGVARLIDDFHNPKIELYRLVAEDLEALPI
jgi:hypothetical protein